MTTHLTPKRERWLLLTLASIQFTSVLDFMIMMPLGPQLTELFDISAGEFGFLVPPKSPVALAEKIELLMNNDEERKSLGKRGKERIYSICSIEKYIASYEDLFETALRAGR